MDMRKYASSGFIKVDDLANGPEKKQIIAIEEGKYDKPVVTFDDGSKFSLNGTNVNTLIRAYGSNDKDWLKKQIELYAGTIRYNGTDNPGVLVRAIDVLPIAERTPPEPQPLKMLRDDSSMNSRCTVLPSRTASAPGCCESTASVVTMRFVT